LANVKLTRYADDWCLLVYGTRADAETWRDEIAEVLAPMGLRLSPDKTLITHIDEGLDFLGWRIQRHRKRGTGKRYVYTYPAKKALLAITARVKMICRMSRNKPLAALIHQLNPVLRGWCVHFRPGVSSRTFAYLRKVVWRQVMHTQARQRTPGRLEGHPSTLLRRWMVAPRWRGEALQPGTGAHHPLLLPGNQNPLTMA
jgi:RNA-directed DNA polymerase